MRNTEDIYIKSVLRRYAVSESRFREARSQAEEIVPVIESWAGSVLNRIAISGSHAKGTAVAGESDLDIFISLRSGTTNTLGDIYWSLYELSQNQGWSPRAQTVSVGIKLNNLKVDLVPARLYHRVRNWHSLYNQRTGSWMQTNVAEQVRIVAQSGRVDEIRAIKIWRNLRQLDFHSFYLELSVIEALRNLSTRLLAENVKTVLQYIAKELPRRRIVDPINSNNIISKDLDERGKKLLSAAAMESIQATDWGDVIW